MFADEATNLAPRRKNTNTPHHLNGSEGDEEIERTIDFALGEDTVAEYRQQLLGNEKALARLYELRGWRRDVLERLEVGLDGERVTLPSRDGESRLVGLCRYLPNPETRNGQAKLLAVAGSSRELFPPPETLNGDGWLFLTEGEPDALRALSVGIPAVGVPGMATWKPEWAERLAGRRVAIVFDCEPSARARAEKVAGVLAGVAAEVRVLDLDPDRDDAYDLTNWLDHPEAENGARKLLEQMAEASLAREAGTAGAVSARDEPPASDRIIVSPPGRPLEVARQFLDEHYADPRHRLLVHHAGIFREWAATHWAEAEDAGLVSRLYGFLDKGDYWATDRDKEPVLASFDPNRAKVANVLEALKAEAHVGIATTMPAWLTNPAALAGELVAVENGLLDVPTRRLHEHSPEFFNAFALGFAYAPEAPPPTLWLRFLEDLWGDDQETIATLGELMGYILVGDLHQQKAFMIVTPKRGGKGTIARILEALLGSMNTCGPTLASLSGPFGMEALIDKPLAVISDARLGNREHAIVAVERLLTITGEDSPTVDRKYKPAWQGRLPTRFLVLTNEIPRFTDASGALASRFIVLNHEKSFYGKEDTELTDKLLSELSGIFNWCLEGYDRLCDRGHFVQPKSSAAAVRHLEDLSSPVWAFVRDRCRINPDGWVDKDEGKLNKGCPNLWGAWKDWCSDEGATPGTKAVFVRDLKAAVPSATPGRRGPKGAQIRTIQGLELIDNEDAYAQDIQRALLEAA